MLYWDGDGKKIGKKVNLDNGLGVLMPTLPVRHPDCFERGCDSVR
jgi:hypothetical protein